MAHLIYADSDLIVVPSMFEPCGLTQMPGADYLKIYEHIRHK